MSVAEFASTASFPQAGPPSEARQQINIRAAHAADRIWGDAAHWYKAIASEGLPVDVRQAIDDLIDDEIRKIVRYMRNITEHWEENRKYFEDPTLPVPPRRSAVRWYKDRDLVNGPWSWTWTRGQGYELSQVLSLDRLLAEVAKVEEYLAGV